MSYLRYKFITGEKRNWNFIYIYKEQQLYTFNANGTKGKIYRCINRKCKCRVLLKPTNEVFRFNNEIQNHTNNCEKRFKHLINLEKVKREFEKEIMDKNIEKKFDTRAKIYRIILLKFFIIYSMLVCICVCICIFPCM